VAPPPDEERAVVEVLERVFAAVGTGREERAVFEVLARESAERLGYEWVSVALGEPYERVLRVLLAAPSGAGGLRVGQRVDPPSGIWDAIHSGRPFVRESLEDGGVRWEDARLRELGVRAYVAIPLRVEARVVGALAVGARDPARLRHGLDLLVQLAELSAAAVVPARRLAELSEALARLGQQVSAPLPPEL
jgi:GAF domain-containing protein